MTKQESEQNEIRQTHGRLIFFIMEGNPKLKDQSLEQTTMIDETTDISFTRNTPHNIVFDKGPPLHACQNLYIGKNIKPKNGGQDFFPQTEKLRNINKPAFGCTDLRISPLFMGIKNAHKKPGPADYDVIDTLCESPQKSNEASKACNSSHHNKIGFNICTDLKRMDYLSPNYQRFGPGPGAYENSPIFGQKNQKIQKRRMKGINRSCDMAPIIRNDGEKEKNDETGKGEKCTFVFRQLSHPNNLSYIPGPGSYDVSSDFLRSQVKSKWREKIKEKIYEKHKKLKQFGINKKLKQENTIKKVQGHIKTQSRDLSGKENPTVYQRVVKNNSTHSKGNKLLRRDLAGKTSQLLPQILENWRNSENPSTFPIKQKFRSSNCFMQKKDHAYEAHIPHEKEIESQYMFIPGRQKAKMLSPSPAFASSSKRNFP